LRESGETERETERGEREGGERERGDESKRQTDERQGGCYCMRYMFL